MYLYKKELLYLHIQILTEKEALSSKVHSIHFYGETERKSVVLCCESKSTLHPPPRARLCLRLRHMSRHRRLERRPVTLHTPSIRSISLSGTQFSHFPRKWHHSLVIVSSCMLGVMCGGVSVCGWTFYHMLVRSGLNKENGRNALSCGRQMKSLVVSWWGEGSITDLRRIIAWSFSGLLWSPSPLNTTDNLESGE